MSPRLGSKPGINGESQDSESQVRSELGLRLESKLDHRPRMPRIKVGSRVDLGLGQVQDQRRESNLN